MEQFIFDAYYFPPAKEVKEATKRFSPWKAKIDYIKDEVFESANKGQSKVTVLFANDEAYMYNRISRDLKKLGYITVKSIFKNELTIEW